MRYGKLKKVEPYNGQKRQNPKKETRIVVSATPFKREGPPQNDGEADRRRIRKSDANGEGKRPRDRRKTGGKKG